jgi:pilus assembly protein CpaC
MRLLVVIFFLVPSYCWSQPKKLFISLGETLPIPLRGSKAIWIQDKQIIAASSSGPFLTIKGTGEGQTLLRVGQELFLVQTMHPLNREALRQFQAIVSSLIGLEWEIQEGLPTITGRLYRLEDLKKLAQIAQNLQLRYLFKATMPDRLKKQLQFYLDKKIAAVNLAPQRIIFEPHLEVRLNSNLSHIDEYQKIYFPFGIKITKDQKSLVIEPVVKVEITIAEVKRSLTIKYGLQGPTSYSAKILASGERELDDLPFNLSAFEGQGYGKILASPSLICRSGKEAEFLSGGEFPIKIIKFRSQEVIWKKYGISLKVRPVADSGGHMSLSLETEVTTIDPARTIDNIPGLHTNRVSSHFDLTQPKTIALSGLITKNEGTSSEGTPYISRIPIIGALFSSKEFQQDQTELIIFVRPSVIDSMPPGRESE